MLGLPVLLRPQVKAATGAVVPAKARAKVATRAGALLAGAKRAG